MKIKQLIGIEQAKLATGTTVVIDIMRAATVAAYAFGQGAASIIPVTTKEEAFALKKSHPEYLLMGEINGYKVEGFDLGNSPSEISKLDLTGKTLVQRTSSGTQGLVLAKKAEKLIFGSFVTCSAIVSYLKGQKIQDLSIVAVDNEDVIFANFLEDILNGNEVNREKVKEELYTHPSVQWFLDADKPEFPAEDIEYALDFDRFNFCCLVKREENLLRAKKIFV